MAETTEYVTVSAIRVDGGTQMRASLNDEVIAEYRDWLQDLARQRNGLDAMPPIEVYFDGESYWLADGFHRLAAWKLCDELPTAIQAVVHAGTRRDAILRAAGANTTHGLRRTNADKRRAVETLLCDEEWQGWSDREIGRRCGVDNSFVSRLRANLTVDSPQSAAPDLRKGADGRVINVANIGRKAEAGATPAVESSQNGKVPPAPTAEPVPAEKAGKTFDELVAILVKLAQDTSGAPVLLEDLVQQRSGGWYDDLVHCYVPAETDRRLLARAAQAQLAGPGSGDTVRWLLYTPSHDVNFKSALERASVVELEAALAAIPADEEGQKTRSAVIQRRLHHLRRQSVEADVTPVPQPALAEVEAAVQHYLRHYAAGQSQISKLREIREQQNSPHLQFAFWGEMPPGAAKAEVLQAIDNLLAQLQAEAPTVTEMIAATEAEYREMAAAPTDPWGAAPADVPERHRVMWALNQARVGSPVWEAALAEGPEDILRQAAAMLERVALGERSALIRAALRAGSKRLGHGAAVQGTEGDQRDSSSKTAPNGLPPGARNDNPTACLPPAQAQGDEDLAGDVEEELPEGVVRWADVEAEQLRQQRLPVSQRDGYDADEWYTPAPLIAAARAVMGAIDLDPASCAAANAVVRATRFFAKAANGLEQPWAGRVWLNPPTSDPAPWVAKLWEEYQRNNVAQAIVLLNNATETEWFQSVLKRFPVCFLAKRVQFWRPDHSEPSGLPRQGQAVFGVGAPHYLFVKVLGAFGTVLERAA